MERARRLEYLRAMGVEAWERRNMPAPQGAPPVSLEADASTPPPAASTQHAPSREISPSPPSIRPQPSVATGAAAEALARIPVVTLARAAGQPLPAEVEAQWESLQAEVLSCTKCDLHSTRTQGVFGVGNRRAEWLVIGEAPGAEEDRRGEPFVGRAGQLLNAMLKAIGLPREQVFIANVLKSRPPNNRDPKPGEVAACLPYLMRQIELLQPRLMLAVGRIAAQNLLATDMALGRLRGQLHHFGELNTPLIVTYHPAYLLRSPADKRKAWEDLKFARSTFQRLASQEQ
ncbi:MAG: uracil-DNA glycosylase family protein [Gammaproteobacteria bacterium]